MGGFRAIARRRPVVRGDRRVGQDPASTGARSIRTRPTAGRPASELHLDWFAHGARGYLAVRGGFDGAAPCSARGRPTCSPDSVRAPLRAGDVVAGRATTPPRRSRSRPSRRGARRTTTSSRSSSLPVRGPTGSRHPLAARSSRPSGPPRTTPTASACASTAAACERAREGELPSEGMVPGAIQVPPERTPDDPARRRPGDRRLPRHRGGDGCLARPARPGSAGHPHPLPARPADLRSRYAPTSARAQRGRSAVAARRRCASANSAASAADISRPRAIASRTASSFVGRRRRVEERRW